MLPIFSYFNKVLCIRGMCVVYFSIIAIIGIALKTQKLKNVTMKKISEKNTNMVAFFLFLQQE